MSEIQKKLTADEAVDVLADRSRIHSKVQAYFGKELVDELLDIVENDEIFELDAMLLQGDLTVDEMAEYLMVLPSYHALNRRLDTWADKLLRHITRNLALTLRESTDKRGRISNKRGLVRMQESVFDMVESFSNIGYATKRNSLLSHLKNYLSQALIFDIWYRVAAEPKLQQYKKILEKFIRSVDENFIRNLGHNFPGIIGLKFFSAFRSAYVKNQLLFQKFLQDDHVNLEDTQDNAELVQKIDADFHKIDELSHFRSIKGVSKKFGDVEVEIYSDEFEHDVRSSDLAYVKISFPGADPEIKINLTSHMADGTNVRSTIIEHDSFQFIINRHNGELTLGSSLIPLDKQLEGNRSKPFISKGEFLKMKAIIFSMLREYLEGKPEDITKVFFKDTKETAETTVLQQETQQQIKETVTADAAEISSTESVEQAVEPTYIYQPFQPSPTDVEPSEEQEKSQVIQDVHLDAIYKEDKVIATIGRITKIPPLKSARGKLRGKGSHVVVRGINGMRFPMPNHSGKDLSPAILKRCLQKLKIPYSVFKTEY